MQEYEHIPKQETSHSVQSVGGRKSKYFHRQKHSQRVSLTVPSKSNVSIHL